MSNLSESSRDTVKFMRGCEVQSLNYEGCVYISGVGEVFMGGEVVDILDTDKKVKKLWKEYVRGEGF